MNLWLSIIQIKINVVDILYLMILMISNQQVVDVYVVISVVLVVTVAIVKLISSSESY